MAYENLCMYCFENMNGRLICPHCGRDSRAAVPQIQMLPGSRVYHSRFLIGRALGQDASGIVYAAFDTKRESPLRIREYLPRDCAERLNDGAVVPVAGREDQFDQGMQKLRAAVEGVDDPRKRHFYFEENGTAYIAQRKAAAPADVRDDEDEEPEDRGGSRRLLVIAVIAAAVVIAAAAGLISLFNGAMSTPQDVVQTPTVNPDEVWIPFETPTPTPYAAPTFAALVDPELAWIDFDYTDTPVTTLEPDSTEVVEDQNWAAATPTAAATPGTDSSKYRLVDRKSDSDRIKALQQQLVKLGWLKKKQVTGKYDDATVAAVKALQRYVNETFDPETELDVDGIAGPKTQLWMYEATVEKPKATATPAPTARTEDTTIQEGSSASKVRQVQQRLITLGLMPSGSADGKYGAATVSAVKKFQQRVNKLQGYAVLDVTGRMDALSQSFLKHYAEEWERLRKATATPAVTHTPTPAPEKIDETDHTTIDSKADPVSIKRVQEMLISIGMMAEGSADGKYGRGTSNAVMQFQQWVNTMRNQQTLKITGIVDPLTRQYLEYCYEREIHPYATPTPSPTPTPTPGPTDTPAPTDTPKPTDTPAPTDTPTPEPQEPDSVGPDSSEKSVTAAQQLLKSVGLLKAKQVTGAYDEATQAAMKAFQQWVNRERGKGTLPEDGRMDDLTRRYLEYCIEHDIAVEAAATKKPTEAPTEEPTEEPTAEPTEAPAEEPAEKPDAPAQTGVGEGGSQSIDPASEPESIQFVQEMLSAAGLLDASGVTGTYDDATRAAVEAFQQWVNRERGEETVAVTGLVDDATRRYLEYTFDRGITVGGASEPADEPEPEPEPEPEEEPEPEPEEEPAGVEDVNITIDGLAAGDDVIYVNDGRFTVQWSAQGAADSYAVRLEDASGKKIVSRDNLTDTSFTVDTSAMARGEVYTVTIGAKPAKGAAVERKARFALPNREISAPEIRVGKVTAGASTVSVPDDSFTLSWGADGDVECYFVTIADEDGNVVGELSETTQTSMTVRSGDITPGVRYTITVGALPVNGGRSDIRESTASFAVPAKVSAEPEGDGDPVEPEADEEPSGEPEGDDYAEDMTPEPTEAPTAKPAAKATKKPSSKKKGKPVITVDGSAFQKDGIPYLTGKSITVSWMAEGKVSGYYIYIENAKGQRYDVGKTTDTSKTVPTSKLSPGKYKLYVGAMPKGGKSSKDARWSSYTFAIPTAKELAAARSGEATPEPSVEPEEALEEGAPEDGDALEDGEALEGEDGTEAPDPAEDLDFADDDTDAALD